MKITAKSNIKHNGTNYVTGQSFDIDDADGKILVADGVAVNAEVAQAAPATPVAQATVVQQPVEPAKQEKK